MKKIYLSIIALLTVAAGFSQNVINGGFETWGSATKADGWYSTNDVAGTVGVSFQNVFKETTTKHSGSNSIRLKSATLPLVGNVIAAVTNGTINASGTLTSFSYDKIVKAPYRDSPDSLTGYIKYTKVGTDTGIVLARFFKNGVKIGEGKRLELASTTGLVRFSIPIVWTSGAGVEPDSMFVLGSSSTFTNNSPAASSELILDDLNFYDLSGIKSVFSSQSSLSIAPNPAKDKATVEFIAASYATYKVQVTDMLGNVVYTNNKYLDKGVNKIPLALSNYNAGIYFVTIESENEHAVKKLVVQ